MKISLIIPMYNEISIAADTAKTLNSYMRGVYDDFEIIFCDDGSTDGCAGAVRDLRLEHVRVTGYKNNRGKGYAVKTGMLEAAGDIVIFTDCDLAYGTEVIKKLCDMLVSSPGYALAIGSRRLERGGYGKYTVIRSLASKVYVNILRVAGGIKQSDFQCGCKAFRHDAARAVFSVLSTDGFAFDYEALLLAGKLGFKTAEVPVKIINHRESKINLARDAIRMLNDVRKIKRKVNADFKHKK
ncbi:MAG: glycosyltransferase [Oscillospiraceae bacterium]|nr:glycosyltransferase [Oscillospiraceae bacterium]